MLGGMVGTVILFAMFLLIQFGVYWIETGIAEMPIVDDTFLRGMVAFTFLAALLGCIIGAGFGYGEQLE